MSNHTITGVGSSGSPRGSGGDSAGSMLMTFLGVCLLIYAVVGSLVKCSVETNELAQHQAPVQPQSKTATIYSSSDSPQPIILTLAGGNYEFIYEKLNVSQINKVKRAAGGAYVVNFDNGTKAGDPDAGTLILIGTPHLSVGQFSGLDRARSTFTVQDQEIIEAVFNKAAPSTGPPHETVKKKVYIVGSFASVEFEGQAGNSEHQISILELEPSAQEMHQYYTAERANNDWHRAYEARRIAEIARRAEAHPL